MKSVIQIVVISSIVIGLLAINFPFSFGSANNVHAASSSSTWSNDNDNNNNTDRVVLPIMPTHPPPPICTAFPGTQPWTDCWNNWRLQMQLFEQQMLEYQAKLNQIQMNTTDGASSSVLVNGYSIRSNGFNINSVSNNGNIDVDVFIGQHDKISVNETTDKRKIRWDVQYPANVTKWLTLVPPKSVNLTSIHHEIKDSHIFITGPAAGDGAAVVSSYGSIGFGVNGADFDI